MTRLRFYPRLFGVSPTEVPRWGCLRSRMRRHGLRAARFSLPASPRAQLFGRQPCSLEGRLTREPCRQGALRRWSGSRRNPARRRRKSTKGNTLGEGETGVWRRLWAFPQTRPAVGTRCAAGRALEAGASETRQPSAPSPRQATEVLAGEREAEVVVLGKGKACSGRLPRWGGRRRSPPRQTPHPTMSRVRLAAGSWRRGSRCYGDDAIPVDRLRAQLREEEEGTWRRRRAATAAARCTRPASRRP